MMQFKSLSELLQDPNQLDRSRIIAISKGLDYAGLVNCYNQGGFVSVYVSEFIDFDRYIMMPAAFWAEIDEKLQALRSNGQKLLLLGLDGYLSILNQYEQVQLIESASRYLDGVGANSLVILLNYWWPVIDQVLVHPKWRQGLNLLSLDEVPRAPSTIDITLIPHEYCGRFGAFTSLRNFLANVEQGNASLDNKAIIAVNFCNGNPHLAKDGRGLSPEIHQLTTITAVLRDLCSFEAPLSRAAWQWIFDHTTTSEVTTELATYFFPDGNKGILREILGSWAGLKSNVEREIYFYLLTKLVQKDSYLALIMAHVGQQLDEFLPLYFCPPRDLLLRDDAWQLAEERAQAIRCYRAGHSWLPTFIQNNTDLTLKQISPWLNIGDESELTEYIRRVQTNEPDLEAIKGYCSEIASYLADVSCGDDKIDDYLGKYRQHKLLNSVTAEYAVLAHDGLGTLMADSRQAILNNYKNDEHSYLLVVDAMGAEYLPFLVSEANKRQLKISFAGCAQVHMPTSTPYNDVKLEWGYERYYKYDGLDKLLHGNYPNPEVALAKELLFLQQEVLDLVQNKLFSFERVVVTADHGASRLAVLAYQENLCQTFAGPAGVDVEDWRYGSKKIGVNLPIADFSTTLADDKAIIKGYNRFSRSGGPGFELHGGDTVEERIVPVIVFEKGEFTALFHQPQKKRASQKPVQQVQLLEKDDFDI